MCDCQLKIHVSRPSDSKTQYIVHAVNPRLLPGHVRCGRKCTGGITISIGSGNLDFNRFTQHPKHDRVLAGIVARPDSVMEGKSVYNARKEMR